MRTRRAFTLVELLVVVGIIAMLIAVLLPTLRGARERASMTDCASRLRELYFAQSQHALANRGKFAGISQTSEGRWERQLTPYLAKDPERLSRMLYCPNATPEPAKSGTAILSSYGLNSFIMLGNWRMRRDAKRPSSMIILFGDKSLQQDDFLTTDDGWFLVSPGETGIFFRSTGHSSHSTYRHARRNMTNAVMTDGHVETFGAGTLTRDSGRWYWGDWSNAREMEVSQGTCCP